MRDPDDARFRQMFDEHFAYVWGALRRLGVPHADAEDRTHEVFLAVHRRLGELDASRPVRPWLFGFAYRVASHHRRSEMRRREVFGLEVAPEDPAAGADEQLAEKQERSILLEALETLDLDRRAVLLMHDWDGIAIPAVARELGLPLNTAYSRLRVAREELLATVKRASSRRRVR